MNSRQLTNKNLYHELYYKPIKFTDYKFIFNGADQLNWNLIDSKILKQLSGLEFSFLDWHHENKEKILLELEQVDAYFSKAIDLETKIRAIIFEIDLILVYQVKSFFVHSKDYQINPDFIHHSIASSLILDINQKISFLKNYHPQKELINQGYFNVNEMIHELDQLDQNLNQPVKETKRKYKLLLSIVLTFLAGCIIVIVTACIMFIK